VPLEDSVEQCRVHRCPRRTSVNEAHNLTSVTQVERVVLAVKRPPTVLKAFVVPQHLTASHSGCCEGGPNSSTLLRRDSSISSRRKSAAVRVSEEIAKRDTLASLPKQSPSAPSNNVLPAPFHR